MKRITTAILLALAIGNGTLAADEKGEAAAFKGIQSACAKLQNTPASIDFLKELAGYTKSISDSELKASLAATYALGMHANGLTEAANSTVQYLRRTFPDSRTLALFATAQYQVECPKCNGSDQIQVPCKRCNGRRRCSGCNGTGSIERIGGRSEQCSFCRGSGECTGCRGTGEETAKCTQCFGARRIVSRQLMREALTTQVEATRKLAFVQEQKAIGLVEFGGRWITPHEKSQEIAKQTALAKAQAAEAERMLAEERRKQAEAEARLAEQQKQQAQARRLEQAQQAEGQRQVAQERAAAGIAAITWQELDQVYSLQSNTSELQKKEIWKKYKGKKIEWSGVVSEISETWGTLSLQVKMNHDTWTSDLLIRLKKSERQKAMGLSKDAPVTFRGILDDWGTIMPITLNEGEILK
jgi:hypothetical protein